MRICRSRSVKNFINNISPLSLELNQHSFSQFIFRGQGNSKWELMPSVFRENAEIPHKHFLEKGPQSNYRDQRKLEWSSLRDFVLELNRNGFHLPNEELFYKLINTFDVDQEYNEFTRMEKAWPSQEYYSLLALAQHFGLPTRLMDWSLSSYIAAYFAAKTCLKLVDNGKKVNSLSVFALDKDSSIFTSPLSMQERIENPNYSNIPIVTYHIIEPPTYFNNNLLAQKGLFICCTEYGNVKNHEFQPVSLTQYIDVQKERFKHNKLKGFDTIAEALCNDANNCLIEFQLPATKAGELLIELDKLFINKSSLFPGISSCIRTLYDRATYQI